MSGYEVLGRAKYYLGILEQRFRTFKQWLVIPKYPFPYKIIYLLIRRRKTACFRSGHSIPRGLEQHGQRADLRQTELRRTGQCHPMQKSYLHICLCPYNFGSLGFAVVNARFWGVSGVYTPLTPQNLGTSPPIPKEPIIFPKQGSTVINEVRMISR